MSKHEATIVLVFALIGLWQTMKWAFAGLDRWYDYSIRKSGKRRRERT